MTIAPMETPSLSNGVLRKVRTATGSGRTVGVLCGERCEVVDVQSLLVDHRSAAG